MLIYPAIDLYEGQAVRLYKGDYNQKTVYNDNPLAVAYDFKNSGATHIHLVDLEGAKSGDTPNFDTVCKIKNETGLFCEIGGGIRSFKTIEKYVSGGIDRVIFGTAAVQNEDFVIEAVKRYGEKIAVGIDIKDGFVAIKGWTENSSLDAFRFCQRMSDIGVKTVICTDISKDGAMKGPSFELYNNLMGEFPDLKFIASGGISCFEDVVKLKINGMYGAIIGKAIYEKTITMKQLEQLAMDN